MPLYIINNKQKCLKILFVYTFITYQDGRITVEVSFQELVKIYFRRIETKFHFDLYMKFLMHYGVRKVFELTLRYLVSLY